jgi:hypothetical protein
MKNFCVNENNQPSASFQNFVKVSGQFNFYVCIDIQRKPGTTNSSIAITTFSKSDRTIAIGSKCKWFLLTTSGKFDLNMTANYYQCSPRDSNRTIEIEVKPYEDGFDGQCFIHYGPVIIEPSVQLRYSEAVKRNYIEFDCQGNSKRSSFQFDLIKADNEEVQCYDRHHNKLVDTVRVSRDIVSDPSQLDSYGMRIVAPGNGRSYITVRSQHKVQDS